MSSYTDVSAWICYLFIAAIGAVVSFYHISSKLAGAAILWARIELWVVYVLYVLFPIALFWLLDVTGELKDTSLLLAIFIALVYRKVLSGENDQVQSPGMLSSYWVSLEALIEKLIENWGEKVHNHNQWRHRSIQRRLREQRNPKPLTALCHFARRLSVPLPARVDEAHISNTSKDISREEMIDFSEAVYIAALKEYPSEFPQIFVEEGILTDREIWFHCKYRFRQVLTSVLSVILGYLLLASIVNLAKSGSFNPEIDYLVWRIGKANSSDKDLHRTSRAIVALMNRYGLSSEKKAYLLNGLLEKLYGVDLAPERAESIIRIFGEFREQIQNKRRFVAQLASILRSNRREIRVIVNNHLLFLAESFGWTVPGELEQVNVSNDLDIHEQERIITQWERVAES